MVKDIYPSNTKFNRSLNFQKLGKLISKNQENIYLNGLYGSSITFFLIDLFSNVKKPIFFITDNKEESSYIYTDIVEQLGENYCSLLPSSFNKFSTKSINKDQVLSRTKILEKFIQMNLEFMFQTVRESLKKYLLKMAILIMKSC